MTESPAIPFPIDSTTGWPVWGQPAAIADLNRALLRGPNHAWIFAGPKGSGRRSAAQFFAKALCCPTERDGVMPCGHCSVCTRIDRGVFPDVSIYNLAGQAERENERSKNLTLNISTVREVASAVAYRPSEARSRIVIVDDVETMQETAQEAFLKTLEEPPSYAVIVLITSDIDALIPTILSRTTQARFVPVSFHAIQMALEATGQPESHAASLAALADGSLEWALGAAADPKRAVSRETELQQAWEFVAASEYDRMVRAIRIADQYTGDREGTYQLLRNVQSVWRTLMYERAGISPSVAIPVTIGPQATMDDILTSIGAVTTCIDNLAANVRPRLALESMVQKWAHIS